MSLVALLIIGLIEVITLVVGIPFLLRVHRAQKEALEILEGGSTKDKDVSEDGTYIRFGKHYVREGVIDREVAAWEDKHLNKGTSKDLSGHSMQAHTDPSMENPPTHVEFAPPIRSNMPCNPGAKRMVKGTYGGIKITEEYRRCAMCSQIIPRKDWVCDKCGSGEIIINRTVMNPPTPEEIQVDFSLGNEEHLFTLTVETFEDLIDTGWAYERQKDNTYKALVPAKPQPIEINFLLEEPCMLCGKVDVLVEEKCSECIAGLEGHDRE